MASSEVIAQIYARQFETVWNICYPFFMNKADTEDAVQETFVRLMRSGKQFRDEQHEKAWLIMTARNVCRDELRRARRRELPLDDAIVLPAGPEHEMLHAISTLPEHYRTVIYLYYYEGCGTKDIAGLLHRPDATVRTWLHRGRAMLKEHMGGI